ncbi:MAG TPA: carboxypeptidase-like regulatory domain-containing protein [Terracidiphilus sp.]
MCSIRGWTLFSPSPKDGHLFLLLFVFLLLALTPMYAATGGSVTGTVADRSGAVIPNATLELVNLAQQTKYHAKADGAGLFTFPNLPVGHYDLTVTATGFTSQKKTGLAIDTDSALKVDFMMQQAALT